MTINSELDKPSQHWMKIGFYAIAILFNLCLIAQLLTVGIAYFNDLDWWQIHVLLVRGYGGLSLILFAGSAIVPFSKRIRSLAASLPVLLGIQFCSIHLQTTLHLEILHPLIGFTLFIRFFNPRTSCVARNFADSYAKILILRCL